MPKVTLFDSESPLSLLLCCFLCRAHSKKFALFFLWLERHKQGWKMIKTELPRIDPGSSRLCKRRDT